LTRDKGLPELCEAFDLILCAEPSTRLLLVGWFDVAEDAVDPGLRMRILRHPRSTARIVPDTAPYYRAMDLLVLPTWREGFPNVVLEAAATGIPSSPRSAPARATRCCRNHRLMIPPGIQTRSMKQ